MGQGSLDQHAARRCADSTGEFVVSDPAVWKFGKDENGNGFLELAYDRKNYKSTYTPKHRSPVHIALLKQYPLTDFVMDVELQSTTEPYDHQSLCLFFGFVSPEKYYYVHLARKADMNAHNVFIVNDAARKNIAKETTKGVEWKKDDVAQGPRSSRQAKHRQDRGLLRRHEEADHEGRGQDLPGGLRRVRLVRRHRPLPPHLASTRRTSRSTPGSNRSSSSHWGSESMIPLFVIDAFTDRPFAGNPAAVCVLERWPADEWLQLVGREMNLSETAFLVRREGNEFDLRWFTPRVEVALCGHATLASAHALWESGARLKGHGRLPHPQKRPTDSHCTVDWRDRTRLPREARDAVRTAGGAPGSARTPHRGSGTKRVRLTSWNCRTMRRCARCARTSADSPPPSAAG